ncbi:MAG: ATP-binding protein, partial [Nakamurella sp.]
MQRDQASTPLADRLRQAAATQFVGRARERAHLAGLLDRGFGPAVVFVSGPGGIGKSALVAMTVAGLDQPVVTLDGRTIEPTPAGFHSALAHDLGSLPIPSAAHAGAVLEARGVAWGTRSPCCAGPSSCSAQGGSSSQSSRGQPIDGTTASVTRSPPDYAISTSMCTPTSLAQPG